MALFDPLVSLQKYEPLAKEGFEIHFGRVISNKDPNFLKRIKVYIHFLLPFDNAEQLPWIYPLTPAGLGSAPLTDTFQIPEEGSLVACMFPKKEAYFGFYFGTTTDRQRRAIDFCSEYPERHGWIDSSENKVIYNKDPDINTTERRYPDGSLFIFDSKNHTISFTDKFGTKIYIDRYKQEMDLQFGKCKISFLNETIKIEMPIVHILVNTMHVAGEKFIQFTVPLFKIIGKKFFAYVSKYFLPLLYDHEEKPKYSKPFKDDIGPKKPTIMS